MISKKYNINKEEINKILNNAAIFFAPAFLLFLLSIQAGSTPQQAALALQVWALNSAIDITRKFIAGR